MELGRSGGVQGDRTDHTKTAQQIFTRFGLTWHRKVHFSSFFGKLTFQCTRNGPRDLPFCPGSLQDTFIIYSSISHQHIFKNIVQKEKSSRIKHLKIWISKNPGSLTGAQKTTILQSKYGENGKTLLPKGARNSFPCVS